MRFRSALIAVAMSAIAGAALARSPIGAPPQAQQTQPILMMTGEIRGTFAQIGSNLADVIDEPGLRLLWAGSHGSLDNLLGLIRIRGVDLGLAAADTLAFARQNRAVPGLDRIQFISKLYDNELHIVARDPQIRTLADLRGRTINIDTPGSGTTITMQFVLRALGIDAKLVQQTPDWSIAALQSGEIDAAAYSAGKPTDLFRRPNVSGLHLVTVPYDAALQEMYLPAEFTHEDYPELVPEGQAVQSVAVGVVLACFGWEPGTERYRNLARFTQLFIQHLGQLQRRPFHAKWREVNLAADVPGWTRFPPAAAMVAEAQRSGNDQGAFTAFLTSIGRADAAGPEREQLLQTWRSLQRR